MRQNHRVEQILLAKQILQVILSRRLSRAHRAAATRTKARIAVAERKIAHGKKDENIE